MTRVEITQADIDGGERSRPGLCPVARAMRRQGYPGALAYYSNVCWPTGEDTWARLQVPEQVTQWLTRYDEGDPVAPFVLELP